MEFFKYVPENFFSLLASKNKKIYSKIILQIFLIVEKNIFAAIDKKIIVDDIVLYLETNKYDYETEDVNDEESYAQDSKDLANYVLRKLEETGWITVVINHDYHEMLSFTDIGITMAEAMLKMMPKSELNELANSTDYELDDLQQSISEDEGYHGYIYTIYSLLYNVENQEYDYILQEVERNTQALIRAIKKMEHRLIKYLHQVVSQSNVKELMESLIAYKKDFVDGGYSKLKMSDNINRYRLRIINKLEEYQNNEEILLKASNLCSGNTQDEKIINCNKKLDILIDSFNSIDLMISEIDNNNKQYVNNTIAKVKFLLSEDDNIIGKITKILNHIKRSNQAGTLDKTMKIISAMPNLNSFKTITIDSLYEPRGIYTKGVSMLIDERLDDLDLKIDYITSYAAPYNDESVRDFIEIRLENNIFDANKILTHPNITKLDTIMSVYSILYTLENQDEFELEILDGRIKQQFISIRNFLIRKKV